MKDNLISAGSTETSTTCLLKMFRITQFFSDWVKKYPSAKTWQEQTTDIRFLLNVLIVCTVVICHQVSQWVSLSMHF